MVGLLCIGLKSGRSLLGRQLVKATAAVLAPAHVYQLAGHEAAADQSFQELCALFCDNRYMILMTFTTFLLLNPHNPAWPLCLRRGSAAA